ncbi:hypothetical protein J6590_030527, partial [Homalodisca vitripennis]
MHMKHNSKHLPAELLTDCLRRMNRRTTIDPQEPSTTPLLTTLELAVAAHPHV